MNYKEYIPSVELSNFIDKFWIASEIENGFSQRILPEACTNFVFLLNENEGTSNVLGVNTKFSQFKPSRNDYYVGVSFQPGILGILTKEDFSQFQDSHIPIAELFPEFNNVYIEQLNEQNSDFKRVDFVKSSLQKMLLPKITETRLLSTSVANFIKADHVNAVENIAKQHHISIRQLQRKFKSEVGTSMKVFSRIIRFNKAVERIKKSKNESLLSISLDLGFYDHSHLTNEIKHFSGVHPSQLR
ncbi:helix-turn-helix transcriptional regulator [Algoriphagus resistens]|uniref:helix-turn-helix transcriptional regulator n=1 Tax=Algoriphagus resistens TaxID=1750590 RepID=UPI000716BB9B|nr:helix-turn-helix transcriptional regulator [Algoriphagus resistens]